MSETARLPVFERIALHASVLERNPHVRGKPGQSQSAALRGRLKRSLLMRFSSRVERPVSKRGPTGPIETLKW